MSLVVVDSVEAKFKDKEVTLQQSESSATAITDYRCMRGHYSVSVDILREMSLNFASDYTNPNNIYINLNDILNNKHTVKAGNKAQNKA